MDIVLEEPVGVIAPEIYGHFVENLGGVVYDGIWVGEESKIPNIQGMRKQLVEMLARIKPGVIRWPGGCFADQYDWRDGTGNRAQRPKRTNFWVDSGQWPANANRMGPQVYDPNQFGTVEFVRFCRLVGAEPYLAANLRSLPAQDYWRWVEYCNSPAGSTELAEQRRRDGETAPLKVRYWGVGNESWGCGGNLAPQEYATEFRRYSAWVPSYGLPIAQIASGPNGADLNWTRQFFGNTRNALANVWGWALHHYSWNVTGGRTSDWLAGKGDALRFQPEQHYELLREGARLEALIQSHWDAMGEVDRQRRVKLVVDEWGAWHAPGTEPFAEALLGQQNTMRDALLAGLSLDIFNRHADKVAMANIAQLVNCLQSLFLAHEDKFCVTPTYHVFDMYAAHQRGQSLRVQVSSPSIRFDRHNQPGTLHGLAGSASRHGARLVVTVTNPSLNQTRETEIVVRGASLRTASAVVLRADDIHAHNSFENPNAVTPRTATLQAAGGSLRYSFAPASVTKLEFTLG